MGVIFLVFKGPIISLPICCGVTCVMDAKMMVSYGIVKFHFKKPSDLIYLGYIDFMSS